MSEGRQVGLVLLALVVLGALGFGGAALFPDACAGLERRGDLVLAYASVDEALGLTEPAARSLVADGTAAGLGPGRGAVALPDDARLVPSEGGFFTVTDEQFTVLRPGFGVVANARGREGEDVLPAHRALALRAQDGTAVLYDGELDELRCGELGDPATVLDVDRGVSVVATQQGEVAAVTLSGEQLWTQDLGAPPTWAWVVDREVVVGSEQGVATVTLADGAPGAELLPGSTELLDARGAAVLLATGDGAVLLDVDAGTTTALPAELPTTAAVVPDGVVGAEVGAGSLVVTGTDVRGTLAVPVGLELEQVVTSDDGIVALVVTLDGRRAALQWGPVGS